MWVSPARGVIDPKPPLEIPGLNFKCSVNSDCLRKSQLPVFQEKKKKKDFKIPDFSELIFCGRRRGPINKIVNKIYGIFDAEHFYRVKESREGCREGCQEGCARLCSGSVFNGVRDSYGFHVAFCCILRERPHPCHMQYGSLEGGPIFIHSAKTCWAPAVFHNGPGVAYSKRNKVQALLSRKSVSRGERHADR